MNEALHTIPENWAMTRLDRVANVYARIGWKALTASEYVDEGYAFLSTTNLRGDSINFEDVNYITEIRWLESPELQLRESDVLMTKDGAGIGLTAVVRSVPKPATVNGSIAVIRPRNVDGRFLFYALSSDAIQGLVGAYKSGMGVPHLFQADLKKFPLMCPPPHEQRSVADYLDSETTRIDALIAKKQRMVELLTELRKATLVEGVAGAFSSHDLGPSNVPWLEKYSRRWRSARLSLIAKLGTGHTPSRSRPEWWVDCTIPWITTGEVAEMRSDRQEYVLDTREKISELGVVNSSATLHPAGTVVLCRTASAGYSAIMATEMATSQDFATWTCGPLLRPRYLLLCLRAMRQDLLGRLALGSTHQTIYMPDIESLKIPLPTVQEQDEIVTKTWKKLLDLGSAEDVICKQIDVLREHRQALITTAVTGQLNIPVVAA